MMVSEVRELDMKSGKLIGKYWPVKNTDNEIVGFKTITDAKDMENVAGYAIELSNSNTYIAIGIEEATDIVDKDMYQLLD